VELKTGSQNPKGPFSDKMLCMKETFSDVQSAPVPKKPLGFDSLDLRSSAKHSPREIYSSTKAKLSVLYFFAMFVMFLEAV
jgi:hypothetical protein